ncbi:MAG: EAL domain-containing protein [Hyphomicrobium sp.]|uniref:EAL domain-containing protein n=1 Tax=Hyphomicrobium sp. TaxID=82 RepID=UPI0039E2B6AF
MTKQDNAKPQASVAPPDAAPPTPALGPAPTSGPAVPLAVQEQEAHREPKSRDGLIVFSIAIVSAAISVMCFSQLGLSLPISAVAGVVTLALLMLVHTQMQKSAQIAQLKSELAHTRQAAKPRVGVPRVAPAAPLPASSTEERIRELSRDIGNLVPRPETAAVPSSEPPAAAAPVVPERVARRPLRALRPNPEDGAGPAAETNAAPAVAPVLAEVPVSPTSEPVREQWSFRPRTDSQASMPETTAAPSGMNVGPQAPNAPVATTVEGDLELVQRKIKELADEVNAAEALRPKPQLVNPRAKGPSNALEDSIGALRAAAKNMRSRPSLGDFVPKLEARAFAPPSVPAAEPEAPAATGLQDLVIPATAERIAGPDLSSPAPISSERDVAPPSLELPLPSFAEPSIPPQSPRAAAIARAVEGEAMEVLLGPVVTLAEHSVSHYDMTANLRSATGEPLGANDDEFALIDGEVGTQFDIARLNRAAALAARMNVRDREGTLFAEFLGSSLSNRAFLEAFARVYEARQRISSQLVLTFSQRAVDAFSPSAWQAVHDMHAYGFRLAMDHVRHMGTDFAALQRAGFRFVRVEAGALLEGLQTAERFVAADEILQRATLAGLSIVAGGIQDAATQKRLLDSGVLLGQGPLFGAPRQVNVDGGGHASADHPAAA